MFVQPLSVVESGGFSTRRIRVNAALEGSGSGGVEEWKGLSCSDGEGGRWYQTDGGRERREESVVNCSDWGSFAMRGAPSRTHHHIPIRIAQGNLRLV